jgi:hypothetical protein
MTRIQPGYPAEPPAPKKAPAAPVPAPPFTPARPRQAAAPQPHAAPPRQPQAKPARQARAPAQGAADDGKSPPQTAAGGRGALAAADGRGSSFQMEDEAMGESGTGQNNRFGGDNSRLEGQFFGGFGQADDFAQSDDDAALQATLKDVLQETLRGTQHALDQLDQGLDSAELARLLPTGGNDGIFDVVLPTGERLGVVVSGRSSSLSYLLSPSPDQFGVRLRRQRMELEQRMERLTQRSVNITVL